MAQNANQVAHVRLAAANAAAAVAANTTRPPLTGNPNIDYKWDPNLPVELHGYDLSNYPFYNGLPDDLVDGTYNFTCDDRLDGFYASIYHQCQVYHNCLFGQRYDFLCANYTVFDQKNFICHYVSLVDCKGSEKHYDRNEELYVTTTSTTERPRRPEVIYVERPVHRPRQPPRTRPNGFFKVRNRAPPQAPPRQPIDADPEQPAQSQPAQRQPAQRQPVQRQPPRRQPGGRRPSNRRPPPPDYDDYYNYDYDYYSDVYYDEYGSDYYGNYDYADEPSTTTTTTTPTPPPRPQRRQRPQRTRLGPGRRPGVFSAGNRPRPNIRPPVPSNERSTRVQDDARPLEQDINPIDKDSENNEPELRKPINRRRPALRPNRPIVKTTTPADPFYDYYDYDNAVSEEPSSTTTTTTTLAPVIATRRPTRPRISRPRRPEPTPEEALITNDQEPEEKNLPITETVESKPVINARRPFRPAPEESSRPAPIRSGSESPVVNARRPFRPVAEESSPKDEVQAREPLGSGRRTQGPRFPSRRKPTTETEPEEVIIEDAPPLAPGIALNAEESPVVEISSPNRSRVRIGSLRRPQRQQPAYEYFEY